MERIFWIKNEVPLASPPASDTAKVLDIINPAFPHCISGNNVLQTGIINIGGIIHPVISLLNAGWIESTGGDFQFYPDGVTPTIANIIEAIERERVSVGSVLGFQTITGLEWLKLTYNTTGEDLYRAIYIQQGFRGIYGLQTLDHRYIHEDIPTTLVPVTSLGHRFGNPVRAMNSRIRIAIIANRIDYWRFGRTLENLSLEHRSASELMSIKNNWYRRERTPTYSWDLIEGRFILIIAIEKRDSLGLKTSCEIRQISHWGNCVP